MRTARRKRRVPDFGVGFEAAEWIGRVDVPSLVNVTELIPAIQ